MKNPWMIIAGILSGFIIMALGSMGAGAIVSLVFALVGLGYFAIGTSNFR